MNYEFICPPHRGGCGKQTFVSCSIKEYDEVKKRMICCNEQMEPVIYGGVVSFHREGFPKGYEITEHCCVEPTFCRDKVQLRDLTQENNCVSRYLEDDM